MAPRSREERDEILRVLSIREREISGENSNIDKVLERAERAGTLLRWAIAGIVTVTLWAARLQWTVNDLEKSVEINGRRITVLETRVSEMWFMKEHGISNGQKP